MRRAGSLRAGSFRVRSTRANVPPPSIDEETDAEVWDTCATTTAFEAMAILRRMIFLMNGHHDEWLVRIYLQQHCVWFGATTSTSWLLRQRPSAPDPGAPDEYLIARASGRQAIHGMPAEELTPQEEEALMQILHLFTTPMPDFSWLPLTPLAHPDRFLRHAPPGRHTYRAVFEPDGSCSHIVNRDREVQYCFDCESLAKYVVHHWLQQFGRWKELVFCLECRAQYFRRDGVLLDRSHMLISVDHDVDGCLPWLHCEDFDCRCKCHGFFPSPACYRCMQRRCTCP